MFATPVAPEGQCPHPVVSFLSSISFDDLWLWSLAATPLGLWLIAELVGLRLVPRGFLGVVEKRWSLKGSVPPDQPIALRGEAGFQPDLLRPGVHLGLWRWQYRVHRRPMIVIAVGKIGYVHARAGEPRPAGQGLARAVDCDDFQDARTFLRRGQRGRQSAILREGSYAINPALFAVLTEDRIYHVERGGCVDRLKLERWQQDLRRRNGFSPVVVDPKAGPEGPVSMIGVVTVHEGPSMPPGVRVAAEVREHQQYQDMEAFLRAGGFRGPQIGVLGRGVYFINRWFATVELRPGERITS